MLSKILGMFSSSSKNPKKLTITVKGPLPPPSHDPLPPIVLVSAACPYCRVVQEPSPKRRRKCQDCDQIIYIRTDQVERKRYLLTKEQADQAERDRRNVRWKELSLQVQSAMQGGDWQLLRITYHQQASILFNEGRPHRHVTESAMKAELMGFQQVGINSVQVSTCQDERVCAECRALDGAVFTVADAMERMPLPGRDCTDAKDKNPHGGRCRCRYSPVFEHQARRSSNA